MNLTDVFLSLPVVKYNTDVIHFAPRKSTQIEWLILEILTKLKNNERIGTKTGRGGGEYRQDIAHPRLGAAQV